MPDPIENPYAASKVDADLGLFTSLPFDIYLYSFVMFCVGAALGGTVSFAAASLWEDAGVISSISLVGIVLLSSVSLGIVAAYRMQRRLANLHRERVAWRIEQAERLGELDSQLTSR